MDVARKFSGGLGAKNAQVGQTFWILMLYQKKKLKIKNVFQCQDEAGEGGDPCPPEWGMGSSSGLGGGAVCHYKKIINQIGAVNLSTRGLIMQDYNMYIFTQLSFEMLYLMRPLEMLAPQSPPSPFSKVKIMVLSMEIWCIDHTIKRK